MKAVFRLCALLLLLMGYGGTSLCPDEGFDDSRSAARRKDRDSGCVSSAPVRRTRRCARQHTWRDIPAGARSRSSFPDGCKRHPGRGWQLATSSARGPIRQRRRRQPGSASARLARHDTATGRVIRRPAPVHRGSKYRCSAWHPLAVSACCSANRRSSGSASER